MSMFGRIFTPNQTHTTHACTETVEISSSKVKWALTDSPDSLNIREVNLRHDENIRWFKYWFTEQQRSKSLSWLKGSLIQTLIQISFMAEWFTESNTDLMNERLVNLSDDQKIHWIEC